MSSSVVIHPASIHLDRFRILAGTFTVHADDFLSSPIQAFLSPLVVWFNPPKKMIAAGAVKIRGPKVFDGPFLTFGWEGPHTNIPIEEYFD